MVKKENMGKFDGILICTDLDGTLYKNDKSISEENKRAIEYFKAEGGYFTFITGRMPYYSMDAYEMAKPNVPFGCINGGGVYDGRTGEYLWRLELPKEALLLVKMIDREVPGAGINASTFYKTYFSKDSPAMQEFRETTKLQNLVRGYMDIDEPIAKIIFATGIEEEMQRIEMLLRCAEGSDRFDFVRSERRLFEILPKGVKKRLALDKLCDILKVDPARSIAIGDYYNDISMFSGAGIGVAVANACPEAIAAADRVTVSNEDHAIAQVIRDIESGVYQI